MEKTLPEDYVTVYHSIGGWKAVLLCWNTDHGGFYEPFQTSFGFDKKEKAIKDGKLWAEAEFIEFREPK